MSLINKVLNQLEQRGAHTAPHQTQVRAVATPVRKDWRPYAWIFIILCLAMGFTLWVLRSAPHQLAQMHVEDSHPVVIQAAQSQPAPLSALPEMVASKLSFELSAPPLPESLRPQTIIKEEKNKSASHGTNATTQRPTQIAESRTNGKATSVAVPANSLMPLKQVSRIQQADSEYRKALVLQQQAHAVEAIAGYESALKLNPQHDAARLALAAQLDEQKRGEDAVRVLQEGLRLKPAHLALSMALARVQVEQGNVDSALTTLQQNLSVADGNADYQAFYAALLQRQGRHKEAINHYQIATRLASNNGVWLMGYGLSLQAVQRNEDAKSAFQKALATQTLTPELTAFVEQKLKGL